jgi:hypothetical protein
MIEKFMLNGASPLQLNQGINVRNKIFNNQFSTINIQVAQPIY